MDLLIRIFVKYAIPLFQSTQLYSKQENKCSLKAKLYLNSQRIISIRITFRVIEMLKMWNNKAITI